MSIERDRVSVLELQKLVMAGLFTALWEGVNRVLYWQLVDARGALPWFQVGAWSSLLADFQGRRHLCGVCWSQLARHSHGCKLQDVTQN